MNDLSEFVAMAREARALAEQADHKATTSVNASFAMEHALGHLAREVAEARREARVRFDQLERLVASAKQEARQSSADLEEFKDDTITRELRKDLKKVRTRERWVLGVLAFVIGGILLAIALRLLGMK